jgi:selenide,water dikinase
MIETIEIMCGGCGAKVGRGALRVRSLRCQPRHAKDIISLPGDDAALLKAGGETQCSPLII